MKVFEVLRTDIAPVAEKSLISRLKSFDWKYEFSNDFMKRAVCEREMESLENQIYQLWKQNPDRAVELWNKYCPYVPEDKNITPSFIFRLQSQEEDGQ